MADIWRQTKILLMPSLWFEGFGIVAVEAMLHGIPVLSSDAGALSSTNLDPENVIHVELLRPNWRTSDYNEFNEMLNAMVRGVSEREQIVREECRDPCNMIGAKHDSLYDSLPQNMTGWISRLSRLFHEQQIYVNSAQLVLAKSQSMVDKIPDETYARRLLNLWQRKRSKSCEPTN